MIAHPRAETLAGTLTITMSGLLLVQGLAVAALPNAILQRAPGEKILRMHVPVWGW